MGARRTPNGSSARSNRRWNAKPAKLSEPEGSLTIRPRKTISFVEIAKVAFTQYPKRAILGLALFIGQAFLYNAFTFNLGTLLGTFYGVASGTVPLFFIVWALSNFAGPLLLGRLFDTVGRKAMIAFAYLGSAVVAIALTALFFAEIGGVDIFIAVLSVYFFLASSGASAAYLTVSEIFPDGDPGVGHCVLLRGRHSDRWHHRTTSLRPAHRHRRPGLVAMSFLIGAAVMAVGGWSS